MLANDASVGDSIISSEGQRQSNQFEAADEGLDELARLHMALNDIPR
jgi:hypothetical protein